LALYLNVAVPQENAKIGRIWSFLRGAAQWMDGRMRPYKARWDLLQNLKMANPFDDNLFELNFWISVRMAI
jgi:hypothetical protein